MSKKPLFVVNFNIGDQTTPIEIFDVNSVDDVIESFANKHFLSSDAKSNLKAKMTSVCESLKVDENDEVDEEDESEHAENADDEKKNGKEIEKEIKDEKKDEKKNSVKLSEKKLGNLFGRLAVAKDRSKEEEEKETEKKEKKVLNRNQMKDFADRLKQEIEKRKKKKEEKKLEKEQKEEAEIKGFASKSNSVLSKERLTELAAPRKKLTNADEELKSTPENKQRQIKIKLARQEGFDFMPTINRDFDADMLRHYTGPPVQGSRMHMQTLRPHQHSLAESMKRRSRLAMSLRVQSQSARERERGKKSSDPLRTMYEDALLREQRKQDYIAMRPLNITFQPNSPTLDDHAAARCGRTVEGPKVRNKGAWWGPRGPQLPQSAQKSGHSDRGHSDSWA